MSHVSTYRNKELTDRSALFKAMESLGFKIHNQNRDHTITQFTREDTWPVTVELKDGSYTIAADLDYGNRSNQLRKLLGPDMNNIVARYNAYNMAQQFEDMGRMVEVQEINLGEMAVTVEGF